MRSSLEILVSRSFGTTAFVGKKKGDDDNDDANLVCVKMGCFAIFLEDDEDDEDDDDDDDDISCGRWRFILE